MSWLQRLEPGPALRLAVPTEQRVAHPAGGASKVGFYWGGKWRELFTVPGHLHLHWVQGLLSPRSVRILFVIRCETERERERDFMDPDFCKNCTHIKANGKDFAGTDFHLLHWHRELRMWNFRQMKKCIIFLSNVIPKSKHIRSSVFPADAQTSTRIYQKCLCSRTDPSAALANTSVTEQHHKPVASSLTSLATKRKVSKPTKL